MRTFTTLDEVAAAAGTEIGTSEWLEIDQDRVDAFADATRRPPVDPRRRRAGGDGAVRRHHRPRLPHPVPAPALRHAGLPPRDPRRPAQLRPEQGALPQPGAASAAGCGRTSRFGEVTDLAAGKQLVVEHTIEIEGHDKPACVAGHVVLLLA